MATLRSMLPQNGERKNIYYYQNLLSPKTRNGKFNKPIDDIKYYWGGPGGY